VLDQSHPKPVGLGFFQRHADLSARIDALHRGSWKRGYGLTVATIMLAMKAFVLPMAPPPDAAVISRALPGEPQHGEAQRSVLMSRNSSGE